MPNQREFTPAAGRLAGVGSYDLLIRIFTREGVWRPRLIERILLHPAQKILEVGCGTGTLAIKNKLKRGSTHLIAIDPDPQVLDIARSKARAAGTEIDFIEGFLDQQSFGKAEFDVIYCSLVLHQVPLQAKINIIEQMITLLKPGGVLHIADYARQTGLMRLLFRLTVQMTDGIQDTQPNADGQIEQLLSDPRLTSACADEAIATPSGRISLFSRIRK